MPSQPTQTDRVEALLRQRGPVGITPVDFLLPGVADGGKPITRVAARVMDLRNRGLTIETAGTRNGVAVYVLQGVTGDGQISGQASIFDAGQRAA